jgi:hypothetical protein
MRLSFKKLDLNKKFIFKLKTFLIINFQSPHRVLNSSKYIICIKKGLTFIISYSLIKCLEKKPVPTSFLNSVASLPNDL